MRSSLLCLGLLALLSACSSGGGGGGAVGSGTPGLIAKSQPRGSFTVEKQTALLEYGSVPAGYELTPAFTCGEKQTYDSRLRAGDVFSETNTSASTTGSSSSTTTTTIRSVDATHMVSAMTLSDLSVSPPIANLPNQVQIELACEITQSKEEPVKCDVRYANWQPPTQSPENESCEMDYDSHRFAETKGTVALGTYRLASGQSVRAQATHRESTNVDVKCGKGQDKKLVGTGTVITDEVQTRDLIPDNATMCTPTTYVYRKTVYQLDNGTVLYATSEETTQSPQH